MANEMDVGSIVLKIRADANGVQEGLKQLESYMGKAQADTAKTSSGIDASTKKMTESVNATSAAQTAAYATMSAAAIKTFMAIVSAIDAGVNASERYNLDSRSVITMIVA